MLAIHWELLLQEPEQETHKTVVPQVVSNPEPVNTASSFSTIEKG